MNIGDKAIKRFGFKRIYEIVSEPVKMWGFTYYEVRRDNKTSLVKKIRLHKIVL